jgi:hypothetical protein
MEAIMNIVTAIVVAVIVVAVAAAAAWLAMVARRRQRLGLRQRFGPEYERLTDEHQSRRKAEAELAEREHRVAGLDLSPLSPAARARYDAEWAMIQEGFVDRPREALKAATGLIAAAMRDRGYPTADYEQILADLSVEHAHTLSRFSDAHAITMRALADGASTEEMRQAMIGYRALFHELTGVAGADRGAGLAGLPPGAGPRDVPVAGGYWHSEPRTPAAMAVDDPAVQAEPRQR